MRQKLKPIVHQRHRFRARCQCLGVSRSGQPTALLVNIRHATTGELLADHVWIDYSSNLMRLGLFPGRNFVFTATVIPYLRAVGGTDYKITRLTDIKETKRSRIGNRNAISAT